MCCETQLLASKFSNRQACRKQNCGMGVAFSLRVSVEGNGGRCSDRREGRRHAIVLLAKLGFLTGALISFEFLPKNL